MSCVYFLIPGLILPTEATEHLSETTWALLNELSNNIESDPLGQAIGQGPAAFTPHYNWLWAILCRQAPPAETAPFAWSAVGGLQLPNQLWQVSTLTRDCNNRWQILSLSAEAHDELDRQLRSIFDPAALMLQRWDNTRYLSAKKIWPIQTRSVISLLGSQDHLEQDEHIVLQGDDSTPSVEASKVLSTFMDLRRQASQILQKISDQPQAEIWISDAGRYRNFYPPTKIRSVLSDDPAVLGWALASGILNHRMGPIQKATSWPEDAPQGDCIAVLPQLYTAWIAKDWNAWQAALPAVIEQIQALQQAAQSKKGCDKALVVGFGLGVSVTISRTLKSQNSILARLMSRRGQHIDSRYWIAFQVS